MLLLLATALAAPSLTLDEPSWLAEDDTAWSVDDLDVTMDQGFVFRVLLDGAPAGVIFVGEGDARAHVPEGADRLRLASLVHEELPAEELAPLVDAGDWGFDVDIAWVVDAEADALLTDLEQVVKQDRAVGYEDEDGIFQVVVTGVRLNEARRKAKHALFERQQALAEVDLDPIGALILEELEPVGRSVIDLHTERTWRDAVPDGHGGPRTKWLTHVADPMGLVHDTYGTQLLATAMVGDPEQAQRGRISGRRHVGPVVGVRFDRAVSNVVFTPMSNVDLAVDVDTVVQVSAEAPTRILPLWLPDPPAPVERGLLPHADHFEVVSVAHRGEELVPIETGFGSVPGEGWVGGLYLLAEPVQPGASTPVKVRTRDRLGLYHEQETAGLLERYRMEQGEPPCPMAGAMACRSGAVMCTCPPSDPGGAPTVRLGAVTRPRSFLPQRPGQTAPYRAEIRAGVQDKKLVVAVSGGTPLQRERDRWWGTVASQQAVVSVGTWTVREEPPRGPMPGVAFHAQGPPDRAFIRAVRGIVAFYDPAMPPFPHRRLTLTIGESDLSFPSLFLDRVARPRAEAYEGMVNLRPIESFQIGLGVNPALVVQSNYPESMNRDVAQAVAAQWWQGHDVARQDAWIPATMPRIYRDLYLAYAYDDDVLEEWERRHREAVAELPDTPWALDEVTHHEARLEQLSRLFLGMVRARIGEPEMLEGFHDAMVAEGPLTTNSLREALEKVGKADLSDVFDYWLAGLQPRIEVAKQAGEGGTEVVVRTDLPFGRFMLPVVAPDGTYLVEVVDGRGAVTVPAEPGDVQVDPEGWLPVVVRRGDGE